MNTFDFGIVGLGVMGRNLLLNMADQKYAVAGLDLDADKVLSLTEEANSQHQIKATTAVEEFVGLIKKPRAIMILVPAGKPVDNVIDNLLPHQIKGILLSTAETPILRIPTEDLQNYRPKESTFLGWESPEAKKEHVLV